MPQLTSTVTPLDIPANQFRGGVDVSNEGAGVLIGIKGESLPTATNYNIKIPSGGRYELPMPYYGKLRFLFLSAGTATIKEWTKNGEVTQN